MSTWSTAIAEGIPVAVRVALALMAPSCSNPHVVLRSMGQNNVENFFSMERCGHDSDPTCLAWTMEQLDSGAGDTAAGRQQTATAAAPTAGVQQLGGGEGLVWEYVHSHHLEALEGLGVGSNVLLQAMVQACHRKASYDAERRSAPALAKLAAAGAPAEVRTAAAADGANVAAADADVGLATTTAAPLGAAPAAAAADAAGQAQGGPSSAGGPSGREDEEGGDEGSDSDADPDEEPAGPGGLAALEADVERLEAITEAALLAGADSDDSDGEEDRPTAGAGKGGGGTAQVATAPPAVVAAAGTADPPGVGGRAAAQQGAVEHMVRAAGGRGRHSAAAAPLGSSERVPL